MYQVGDNHYVSGEAEKKPTMQSRCVNMYFVEQMCKYFLRLDDFKLGCFIKRNFLSGNLQQTLQNFQFWIIKTRLKLSTNFSKVTLKGSGVRPVVSVARTSIIIFKKKKKFHYPSLLHLYSVARGIQVHDVSDVCNVFDDNDVLCGSDNVMSMMNAK